MSKIKNFSPILLILLSGEKNDIHVFRKKYVRTLTCSFKINVPFDLNFFVVIWWKIWRTISSEGKVVVMEPQAVWKEMLIEKTRDF